jgi:hypothetical protein
MRAGDNTSTRNRLTHFLSLSGPMRDCVEEYSTAFIKQTPWPLVRKRIIPTDRPPLVDEI